MTFHSPQALLPSQTHAAHRVAAARMLLQHGPLETHDLSALEAALEPSETIAAGSVLSRVSESSPFAIAEGWVGLVRTAPNGHRQILTLFLSGDIVGFDTATAPLREGEVVALTPCKIRRIPARGRALLAARPRLVQVLAAHNLQHQARLQDQVFRIGVLTSLERVAHLLCELHARLSAVSADGRCMAPIKQEILAQVLGISLVHINRILQTLSQQRLAWFDRGRLVIPNPSALRAIWRGS